MTAMSDNRVRQQVERGPWIIPAVVLLVIVGVALLLSQCDGAGGY
jgi:hypothetical protein